MFPGRRFRTIEEWTKYIQIRSLVTGIMLVLLIGYMIYYSFIEKKKSYHEKQLAIEQYADDPAQLRKIEAHHNQCFEISYHHPTRMRAEYFDRHQYRKCLDIGPEKLLQEIREIQEKRMQYERERQEFMK